MSFTLGFSSKGAPQRRGHLALALSKKYWEAQEQTSMVFPSFG